MLVVTGIIEVNPENLGPARVAAIKMMEETRKEAGCRVYEFSQLIESENRFRVYEEWDDQAALDAHFASAHMGAFREALGEIGVISRMVVSFSGGEKTEL